MRSCQEKTMIPNARFWQFLNDGWVKLTLSPGQTLNHFQSWQHEEGWSSIAHTWRHLGPVVVREEFADGRDCDGRLQQYHRARCPLSRLHAGRRISRMHEEVAPDWQVSERSQRDFTAERAGY